MVQSVEKKKADELFHLAREKQKAELHEEALELIEQAIILNSSDTTLWSLKGESLLDLKRFTDAEAAARTAIEKDPKNYHAWVLYGRINATTGFFQKAAYCYGESLKFYEDTATYTLLAAAEYEFDLPSSIKHSQKALELNPEWEEAAAILKSARKALEVQNKK